MASSSTRRHGLRGFSLLEILVSLIVLAIMVAVGIGFLSRRTDTLADQSIATQMQRIGDAATAYANDWISNPGSPPPTKGLLPMSTATAKDFQQYLPPGYLAEFKSSKNKQLTVTTPSPLGDVKYQVEWLVVIPQVNGTNGKMRIEPLVFIDNKQLTSPVLMERSISIAQQLGAGGFYTDLKDRDKPTLTYWNSFGQLTYTTTFNDFFPSKKIPDRGSILYAPYTTGLNIITPPPANGGIFVTTCDAQHPQNLGHLYINANGSLSVCQLFQAVSDSQLTYHFMPLLVFDQVDGFIPLSPSSYTNGSICANAYNKYGAGGGPITGPSNEGSISIGSAGEILSCQAVGLAPGLTGATLYEWKPAVMLNGDNTISVPAIKNQFTYCYGPQVGVIAEDNNGKVYNCQQQGHGNYVWQAW